MALARLIYKQSKEVSTRVKASTIISFIKGKQPHFTDNGLTYLTIDTLEGNGEMTFSDSGVKCTEKDILMVMDGAASGRCYFGHSGYVGSTLAKIECNGTDPSIVYLALEEHENDIQKNTTGSAIPHTDKRYVGELLIPQISNQKTIFKISSLMRSVIALRKGIVKLRQQKSVLMNKYF